MITQNQLFNEPQIHLNFGLRRQIELFEAEAWHDMYVSALPSLREKLGIKLISLGNLRASVIPSVDIPALNKIIGAGLLKPLKPSFLDVLKGYLQATGVKRFFLQLHPEAVPWDLPAILEVNSFQFYNKWVKFYRDSSPVTNPVRNFYIKRIDKKDKFLFSDILLESFNWPSELSEWIAGTAARKRWNHYLAYDGNKPAGTGMSYINGKFAWLGFASTLPDCRGKGIQQAMLTRRIEDCIKQGVKIMVIETAENLPGKPSISNSNVQKAGFIAAYERSNYLYRVGINRGLN